MLDENDDLYLLLRLSTWHSRQETKGRLGGALWIRHIAEVIRRAFEEVHDVKWIEEDYVSGHWPTGAREREFGSERPLDDDLKAIPFVTQRYGLYMGSAIRWYVEGETEFYAIQEILPRWPELAIELVNLRGSLRAERDNAALKLQDWLETDRKFRRFSMITFDKDCEPNARSIRRQIDRENIVGYIAAHDPDFEFANFSIDELVDVAAELDEGESGSGTAVRRRDWSGVASARQFADEYRRATRRSLKGEAWGRALARFALKKPERSDSAVRRPFLDSVRVARLGTRYNYELTVERQTFDRETFRPL